LLPGQGFSQTVRTDDNARAVIMPGAIGLAKVDVENNQGGTTTEVVSGEDGNWQADFFAVLDLAETMQFSARLPDEDFDFTFVDYRPDGH